MEKPLCLVFLRRDDQILLAMKKRGFGQGRWNGAGGKVESGETIEQGMIREAQEEIAVTPTVYDKVADIRFNVFYTDGEQTIMHVHVFVATEWEGEPTETEEMAPRWFSINELPYDSMWADDRYWLPLVLADKKLSADFTFDKDDNVTSADITEITNFEKE